MRKSLNGVSETTFVMSNCAATIYIQNVFFHALQPFWPGTYFIKIPSIVAHSYLTLSARGLIPLKSSHSSPLQPTVTSKCLSWGIFLNSLPLQLTLTE